MRKHIYTDEIREQADQLRKDGKTYTEIQKVFPIPKSTLSLWFSRKHKKVFNRKKQLTHLKRIRVLASAARRNGRLERDAIYAVTGKTIAQLLPTEDIPFLKSLLAMLYWAEGAKYPGVSGCKFVNTDPRLVRLYMMLLRRSFAIDETRFRIRLHLHYYHKKTEAVRFWSKLLHIPPEKFAKPYIKKRSLKKRFRKNFMGICLINYLDSRVRKEILELGYAIHDRITA